MEKNHVDEIMCRMQSTSKKAAIVGLRPLPMRMGVAECRRGSRAGSRETYRVSRANKKVCLRVNVASRPERAATEPFGGWMFMKPSIMKRMADSLKIR